VAGGSDTTCAPRLVLVTFHRGSKAVRNSRYLSVLPPISLRLMNNLLSLQQQQQQHSSSTEPKGAWRRSPFMQISSRLFFFVHLLPTARHMKTSTTSTAAVAVRIDFHADNPSRKDIRRLLYHHRRRRCCWFRPAIHPPLNNKTSKEQGEHVLGKSTASVRRRVRVCREMERSCIFFHIVFSFLVLSCLCPFPADSLRLRSAKSMDSFAAPAATREMKTQLPLPEESSPTAPARSHQSFVHLIFLAV
jgi:hypothetical protein